MYYTEYKCERPPEVCKLTNSKLKGDSVDNLCRALLLLESEDECYRFFEDICTINELKLMAQRLEVARMLQEGRTYQQIENETGASTATISRVKRFLHYGAGGYSLVLERMKEEQAHKSND
jgi:TrpR-related protein YerC/YecD